VYWCVGGGRGLIVALRCCRPASAKTPTASIVGKGYGSSGVPVEGAKVTLTNQGTNYAYSTPQARRVGPVFEHGQRVVSRTVTSPSSSAGG